MSRSAVALVVKHEYYSLFEEMFARLNEIGLHCIFVYVIVCIFFQVMDMCRSAGLGLKLQEKIIQVLLLIGRCIHDIVTMCMCTSAWAHMCCGLILKQRVSLSESHSFSDREAHMLVFQS